MARTYPSDGQSPLDGYASVAPDRALAHFQWDVSGTTVPAGDGVVVIDLNDAGTATTGTIRGLYISIASTATRSSGSQWLEGIAIDMSITGTFFRYMAGIDIYWSITSGLGAKNNYGIYMYFDDMGSGTVDAIIPLGIDRAITSGTNAGDWDCFARFVVHGDGYATTIFSFEGSPSIATNLFHFEHNTIPVVSAAVSGDNTMKIRVKCGTTTMYIPLYSA